MNTPGIIQEIGAAIAASPVCGRLAEVSIEVAVLALAVWGLIRLLRIRSARVCSLLWILVLAKGLLGLAFGAPFELAGLRVAASAGAGQSVAAAGMTAEELALRDAEIRRALSEMESLSTTARAGSHGAAGREKTLSPAQIAASQRDRGMAARWEAVLGVFSVRHAAWVLVGVWVMGVLWGLLRTALDLRRIRRLCLASAEAPEELLAVFRGAATRLGIARGPGLRICDQVESPALVGFLRPAVLVPRWLAETSDPERVRWILAHELMHWKLKDTVGLFVRRMAEALLWFHPAVWWAGGRWEEAMERACDRALIAGETDARDYAGQLYQVLEDLVERRSRVRVRAGLFATRTQIGRRIAALLTTPLSAPSRLSPSALTLLVLLALAALSFGVGINQAAPEQEKGKASASKEQAKPVSPDNPLGLSDDERGKLQEVGRVFRDMRFAFFAHNVDYGKLPVNLSGLTTPVSYIERIPDDPFGEGPIHVDMNPADSPGTVRVGSVGPDGKWDDGRALDPDKPGLKGDLVDIFDPVTGKAPKGTLDRFNAGMKKGDIPVHPKLHPYINAKPADGQSEQEKEKAAAGRNPDRLMGVAGKAQTPPPLRSVQEKESSPGTDQQKLAEIPEPLDRRLLEHIPKDHEYERALVEPLLDLQEKEKRPNALLYYVVAGFQAPNAPDNTQDALIPTVLRDGWSEKAAPLRPYIEAWQPAFGLIRKGAAFDYAKGIGYHGPATPVPNFMTATRSAKALGVQGRYFESVGRYGEALEDYLTVIAMGRDYMSSGNFLVSHLIGSVTSSIGRGQIRALITSGNLGHAHLERCRTRLEAIDKTYPSIAEGSWFEMLFNLKPMLDRIRKDGNAESLIAEWKISPETATELRQAVKDIDRIEADYKKLWDTIVRNAETPWGKQNREEYEKELERIKAASHPLLAKAVPNFLEAKAHSCTDKASLRLARVAAGLEIYKLEHGRYPDSLDALTPAQVGAEPPVDPFSGKLFRYRLDADRYAMWSIGPDSADNAGETIYDPTNGTMSAGDIVLKLGPAQTTGSEAPAPVSGDEPKRLSKEQEELVRNKAGRALADLRSLATAMEAYRVDYDTYASSLISLTTPIAYLSRVPSDPFSTRNPPEPYRLKLGFPGYPSGPGGPFGGGPSSSPQGSPGRRGPNMGTILYSVGPDGIDQQGGVVYDPAQGEKSPGDIIWELEGRYKMIEDQELAGKIQKQQAEVDKMKSLVQLWYGWTRQGLPENMEVLVKDSGDLKEVPEDMFVPGRKISYRLDNERRTAWIYSYGPDGDDDGGKKPIIGFTPKGQIPNGDVFAKVELGKLQEQYPKIEIPDPLDRRLVERIPKYHDSTGLVEALVNVQEKENRPNALLRYEAAYLVRPTLPNNAQTDLIQTVRHEGWSEKTEPLKPYLEAWRPAFDQIRKGAALDYARGIGNQGPTTPVPNFLSAQSSAGILCVQGQYLESLGKHREALENYLAVLTMGRDYMSPDCLLISHLIGMAITSRATTRICALVATSNLNTADLERCRTRLEAIDKTCPSLVEPFRFESQTVQGIGDKTRKEIEKMRKEIDAESATAGSKIPPEYAAMVQQAAKDLDRVEAYQKKHWDFVLRNAEIPWWERNKDEYERTLAQIRQDSEQIKQERTLEGSRLSNPAEVLNAIAFPNFLEAEVRRCSALAGLRLARVATALAIYKLEHKRYPDSLDALTPAQVGSEPPVDPFSGKFFRYRLDGDRYAMWSLGPDSADNAAETIYDPTNGTMSQGDIILRR